jgi:hypothetical protein
MSETNKDKVDPKNEGVTVTQTKTKNEASRISLSPIPVIKASGHEDPSAVASIQADGDNSNCLQCYLASIRAVGDRSNCLPCFLAKKYDEMISLGIESGGFINVNQDRNQFDCPVDVMSNKCINCLFDIEGEPCVLHELSAGILRGVKMFKNKWTKENKMVKNCALRAKAYRVASIMLHGGEFLDDITQQLTVHSCVVNWIRDKWPNENGELYIGDYI